MSAIRCGSSTPSSMNWNSLKEFIRAADQRLDDYLRLLRGRCRGRRNRRRRAHVKSRRDDRGATREARPPRSDVGGARTNWRGPDIADRSRQPRDGRPYEGWLLCGWVYAGTSGAVITTILGAITLMLVRKVSPQFFLLLSGARSIDPEDMPALFGIIAALCRRAGIGQVPSLYFLPSGVPTAFATGVGDRSVIVVSSGLLRLLMTRELTGVLAHEIIHIAKHDVELMQLAGP
jgi:Peptidase family M48